MNVKTIPGYRLIKTFFGDTVQAVAARELGDAGRWHDLVDLNGLVYPYITDDRNEAGPGVILTGTTIKIPSNRTQSVIAATAEDLYGRDIKLAGGRIGASNGDFDMVAGVDNLAQAMRHLVLTDNGELLFHRQYGCSVRSFLGASNSRGNGIVAGALVKRSVAADRRIERVTSASVDIRGDATTVAVTAEAIHALPLSFSEVL